MTVCVAAMCDGGNSLVLIADKMIGMQFVEAEPDIQKVIRIHKDWCLMFAGSVPPVFDIAETVRTILSPDKVSTTDQVMLAVVEAYQGKRLRDAELLYLKPHGFTIQKFIHEGAQLLPSDIYRQLAFQVEQHSLELSLLVAGFNESRRATMFSVRHPGLGIRHDIPGFHAIGSGDIGALYMLYWRSLSPSATARIAVFGALEAKYFAEAATGVGTRTDIYVLRADQDDIRLDEDATIEDKLFPICFAVEPGSLTKRHLEILNALPELAQFPPIDIPGYMQKERSDKPKAKKAKKATSPGKAGP